jgi:hypothetical protein
MQICNVSVLLANGSLVSNPGISCFVDQGRKSRLKLVSRRDYLNG